MAGGQVLTERGGGRQKSAADRVGPRRMGRFWRWWGRLPAGGGADGDHGGEDGVPCGRGFEHGVREHAAVPADVVDAAAGGVFEPVGGAPGDVEFSVRIVGGAVATGFVVIAGAVDAAVVLGDVEVDGPRAEGVGHFFVGGPKIGVGVAWLEEGVFRGVVAEEVEVGVGEVGLEADGFGHAGGFEGIEHGFP